MKHLILFILFAISSFAYFHSVAEQPRKLTPQENLVLGLKMMKIWNKTTMVFVMEDGKWIDLKERYK